MKSKIKLKLKANKSTCYSQSDNNLSPIDDTQDNKLDHIHKYIHTLDSSNTNTDVDTAKTITDYNLIQRSNKKNLNKRGSMTDIDFQNRQAIINEIKESTRILVQFTIKNLNKEKTIEHFRNELFISDIKDKEFEFYYEFISILGEGSSSVVKLCRRKSDEQLFAVKIFRAFDDECINFAQNEFNNMKKINSEFVAKVYEMFYDQNKCKIYTVMEYCKGFTLQKLISEVGVLTGKCISNSKRKYSESFVLQPVEGDFGNARERSCA